jgi:hypothetical protein
MISPFANEWMKYPWNKIKMFDLPPPPPRAAE